MSIQISISISKDCVICLEMTQQPIVLKCHDQTLCYPCFKRYIFQAVKDMSYQQGQSLKCPSYQQNQPLSIETCLALLKPDDLIQFQDILFQKYLRQSKDVQRCPLSTCSYAYLPEKCLLRKQSTCPMCYTQLNRPFSLSLTPLITFIYITFMTNNCPRCQIPIDRISGCYHMTCSCGHEFCWYCLKDYKITNNTMYKQHNQKDCLFLLLMKIFIVIFCISNFILVYSGSQAFNLIMYGVWRVILFILKFILIDGAIAIQFIFLNNNYHYRTKFKRLLIMFCIMDIITLIIIYMLGDLQLTVHIIGMSLIIAGCGMLIGMTVAFSVSTWFDYIR